MIIHQFWQNSAAAAPAGSAPKTLDSTSTCATNYSVPQILFQNFTARFEFPMRSECSNVLWMNEWRAELREEVKNIRVRQVTENNMAKPELPPCVTFYENNWNLNLRKTKYEICWISASCLSVSISCTGAAKKHSARQKSRKFETISGEQKQQLTKTLWFDDDQQFVLKVCEKIISMYDSVRKPSSSYRNYIPGMVDACVIKCAQGKRYGLDEKYY